MSVDMSSHSSKDGSPPPPSLSSMSSSLSHISPPASSLGYLIPGPSSYLGHGHPHPSMLLHRPPIPIPGYMSSMSAAAMSSSPIPPAPMLLPTMSSLNMTGVRSPPGDLADMRLFINRSLSPPPFTSSDPTANECKMVEYRGKKIASFVINGKTMLCLPQAFEIFLKHLVGGLHTVYTKCKRLDIIPIVCNVEQVRVLRGLGAIQPGVNRCKLLSDSDFDELYKDCTTQRPGRPPKRGVPFSSSHGMETHSIQSLLRLSNSGDLHHQHPLPPSPLYNHHNPHQLLLHPSSASAAAVQAAAFLHQHVHSQGVLGGPQIHFPTPLPAQESLGPHILPNRFHNISEGVPLPDVDRQQHRSIEEEVDILSKDEQDLEQKMTSHKEHVEERSNEVKLESGKNIDTKEIRAGIDDNKKQEMDEKTSNITGDIKVRNFALAQTNLDSTSKVSDKTTIEELNDTSEADDDDIDTGDTDDSTDEKDEDNVKLNNNTNDVMISRALQSPKSSDDRNGLASMEGLLGNIQEMVRVAARNALQQSSSSDQNELQLEIDKEKQTRHSLKIRLKELRKNKAIYLRRLRKEKKLRHKLEKELQLESKKRSYFEDAINNLRE